MVKRGHCESIQTVKLSNNSISKSIMRMEYHMLENSYPTYNDIHKFKRNRWFEKFAVNFSQFFFSFKPYIFNLIYLFFFLDF